MKKFAAALFAVLFTTGLALGGGPDNYAAGAASTQPRSFGAIPFDGAFGNPALVGLGSFPRVSVSFFPTSFALWGDRYVPSIDSILPINFNDIGGDIDKYIGRFFRENYGLNEQFTPQEVYDALTSDMEGIGFYTGMRTSPFVYATRGFGISLSTYIDAEVRLPGAFLLPRFSIVGGYPMSSSFDLSMLEAEAIWASEIAVKLGFSMTIPAIRDYLNLDKGAAGVGFKLIAGHSYLKAETAPGSALAYDSVSRTFKANAATEVTTVGTGPRSTPKDYGDFIMENPINGQGWGLDLGTIFHNKRHFVSLDVQDIGAIFWNGKQAHKRTIVWDDEFHESELGDRIDDLFDLDSLEPTNKAIWTTLPTSLNLGYGYHYALPENSEINFLIRYLTGTLGYKQQLALGPGRNSYMPKFSGGAALGLLDGMLPVRYGIIWGGQEELASVAGVGFDIRHASLDFYYKTIGSPWVPAGRKGFEAAAGLTFRGVWTQPPPKPAKKGKPKTVAAAEEPIEEFDEFPEEDDLVVAAEPEPEPVPVPVAVEKPYEPLVIQMRMLSPPPEPTVEEKKEIVTAQRAINFRSGGAELTPGSYPALDAIAELLKQYPHVRYEIQGHTDAQGGDMLNLRLSAIRAGMVKQYLISKGAPAASLISIGYGRNMPIASNATAQGRAANRRVEFVQILSQEQYETLRKFEAEMERNLYGR